MNQNSKLYEFELYLPCTIYLAVNRSLDSSSGWYVLSLDKLAAVSLMSTCSNKYTWLISLRGAWWKLIIRCVSSWYADRNGKKTFFVCTSCSYFFIYHILSPLTSKFRNKTSKSQSGDPKSSWGSGSICKGDTLKILLIPHLFLSYPNHPCRVQVGNLKSLLSLHWMTLDQLLAWIPNSRFFLFFLWMAEFPFWKAWLSHFLLLVPAAALLKYFLWELDGREATGPA